MSVSYGGDSITFADGSVQSGGWTGMRNRIINGAMVIDQRNAGASVTQTTANLYVVDRFFVAGTVTSKFTAQQNAGAITPPAGFINYLGLTSSSAYTVGAGENYIMLHRIEGTNISDLGWGTATAQTVTLSFWVRSSLTGTFGGSLKNSASDRSYPFSYTISSANTWEQKSITIAGDTTGTWLTTTGIGISIIFSMGTGSTLSGTAGAWAAANYTGATGAVSVVGTNGATFYITGVQLERGSTASSFDYRPYGTELALCQRYAYVNRVLLGTFGAFGLSGFFENTTTANIPIRHPVEMRASPTFTFSAANTFITQGTSNITPSAMAVGTMNSFGGVLQGTISGATAGAGCHLIRNNSNGTETTITASAEL